MVAESDLDRRIGERVRVLRAAEGLSLEAAAARTGVSRSMISLIERGETSPTAVVLEKLAAGFGVPLSSLFEPAAPPPEPSPLSRRADQVVWKDPASGYVRRALTPPGARHPLHLIEVNFPAGARVAFENGGRDPRTRQQVWVLAGSMELTVGRRRYRIGAGDCLAMDLSAPIVFRNPGRRAARYLVAITDPAAA